MIFWKAETTNNEDIDLLFTHSSADKIMVIENRWLERLRNTKLYVYEFDATDFHLFEEAKTAGYYITHKEVKPIKVEILDDLLGSISSLGIELRVTPSLRIIRNAVLDSTVDFSIIRYANAVE